MAVPDSASGAKPQQIGRQAIVIVHGQGQQRPMGTIRDFVDTLWRFNPQLGPIPVDGRPIWIVPDDKGGLYDLQRVTTPDHSGRRTDFFELYYADLLDETPIRNLWRWVQRLLWVDPADVTPRMRWPWSMMWLLSLLALGLLFWVLLSIPTLLHGSWTDAFASPHAWIAVTAIGVALVVLLLPRFFDGFDWLKAVPVSVVFAAIVLAFGIIYFETPVIWGAAALGYLGYFAWNYLLPLFGDAASYLSAHTETVRSRQAVRERGLRLLRALHDDPQFDRVIVVAHSLGTVLAFDLLQILWHSVGPTKENPPGPEGLAALQAVETFATSTPVPWGRAQVDRYQALQWAAYHRLRLQPPRRAAGRAPAKPAGWKISDFVTFGSPLGNAQFLVADGRKDFLRMKQGRLVPTAPPQPYDIQIGPGFIDTGRGVTHHAAVFSTVRWTNLYDSFHPLMPLLGDLISAPVAGAEGFGEGMLDQDVKVMRKGQLGRLFTHDHYWREPNPGWVPPSPHVTALRDAVGFDRI